MQQTAVRDGREVAKAKQSMRSREKILAAAAREFGDKGLSGARVTAIAKRAGMNVQALYHHFGDKDQLYTAVVENIFAKQWREEVSIQLAAMQPDEAIRHLFRYLFSEFGRDRTFVAILSDANTHKARHVKNVPAIRVFFARVIEELGAVIARGEAIGAFRPGLDPALLFMLINGAMGTFLNHSYTMSTALGRDLRTKESVEQWETFLLDFIIQGLRRS